MHGISLADLQRLNVDVDRLSPEGRQYAEQMAATLNLPLRACLQVQAQAELYSRLAAHQEALEAMEGKDNE